MKENKIYVVYYYQNYDGPYYLGYVDNEEEANTFKGNEAKFNLKKEPGTYIDFKPLEKMNINALSNIELGYEFKFKIGSGYNEEYRTRPVECIQNSYNITDTEKLTYDNLNHISVVIHNSDEYNARARAKFYYKELMKYIIITDCSIDEAVRKINEKIIKNEL